MGIVAAASRPGRGRCCGNLTQSCVPGMTSLGGRVGACCLGIAVLPGTGGRTEAEREKERKSGGGGWE